MTNKTEIKKGSIIKVTPFEFSQHLSKGTVITPSKTHRHNGYKSVKVADIIDMEDGTFQAEVIVNQFGDVDEVPLDACELIENTRQDDAQSFTLWALGVDEYERQWATSLHPWAWRGIGVWFVVFNVVGVVALVVSA